MKRFFLTLLFLLAAAQAWSATYWVSKSGSNANACINSATPLTTTAKLTINAGIDCLTGGDKLEIRTGTFDESILFNSIPAGTSGAPTIISGYLSENPFVQPTTDASGVNIVVLTDQPQPYVTFQNFTVNAINMAESGRCFHLGGNGNALIGMTCLNSPRDAIALRNTNQVVRNSIIRDCGRIQPPGDTDTKGGGLHVLGDWNVSASGALIEGNLIEGCRGGGIWVQQNTGTTNVIIRRNVLRNFGTYSTWSPPVGFLTTGSGMNIGHGTNYQIYENIIYRVRAHASLGDSTCFHFWGGAANHQIYNNTCYDVDNGTTGSGGAGLATKNNIFSLVNSGVTHSGTSNDTTNNLTNPTVSATFISAAAGNFGLIAGSPALNAGTTLITTSGGISVSPNCTANPDIGALQTWCIAQAEVGNINNSTIDLTATINDRQPLIPATAITGFTTTCGTISSATRVGNTHVNLVLSAPATVPCTYSYSTSTGNVSNSALIGNLMNQRLNGITTVTVTNNTGGGGDPILAFTTGQFWLLTGATDTAWVKKGEPGANITTAPASKLNWLWKVKNTSTAFNLNPRTHVRYDGGSIVALTDSFVNAVKALGNGQQLGTVMSDGSPITQDRLASAHPNVPCTYIRSAASAPTLNLTTNTESECVQAIEFDVSAILGKIYEFFVFTDAGVQVAGGPMTVTIGSYASSGPR